MSADCSAVKVELNSTNGYFNRMCQVASMHAPATEGFRLRQCVSRSALETFRGTKSREYLNLALTPFQSCPRIAPCDKVLVGDDSALLCHSLPIMRSQLFQLFFQGWWCWDDGVNLIGIVANPCNALCQFTPKFNCDRPH